MTCAMVCENGYGKVGLEPNRKCLLVGMTLIFLVVFSLLLGAGYAQEETEEGGFDVLAEGQGYLDRMTGLGMTILELIGISTFVFCIVWTFIVVIFWSKAKWIIWFAGIIFFLIQAGIIAIAGL